MSSALFGYTIAFAMDKKILQENPAVFFGADYG